MKNNIPLNTILSRVCDHFNITETDLKNENKCRKIAYVRQIYSYLAKEHSGKSFKKIGEKINRYHATIQFSVRKIKSEKAIYKNTQEDILQITKSFSKIDFIVTNVDLLQIILNNNQN